MEDGEMLACSKNEDLGLGNPRISVAIPLISIEGQGFEVDEVVRVATAAALDFLSSPPRRHVTELQVVIVAEEGTLAIEELRKHVPGAAQSRDERRLVLRACALPDVGKLGAPCAFLVNPCNWLLVGRGGRTNVLVNEAAGPCLAACSKIGRKRAFTADPFLIQLPPESPLRASGVENVIQVLGPNLDSRFPDCLASDMERARRLLRLCYDRSLACFWEAVDASASSDGGRDSFMSLTSSTASATAAKDGAEVSGNKAVKHSSCDEKVSASPVLSWVHPSAFPEYERNKANAKAAPQSTGRTGGGWRAALYRYLEKPTPSWLEDSIFYEDARCMIVYDAYPKARHHLLLLPKPGTLDDATRPSQLRGVHLPALRYMHRVARAAADGLSTDGAGAVRCGYHAIPSLEPVHVHIISEDFDSPCLKKMTHWNSFTTGFFLECSWVERQLAASGSLELDMERYRAIQRQRPTCFRCGGRFSNISRLKEHHQGCRASPSPSPSLSKG